MRECEYYRSSECEFARILRSLKSYIIELGMMFEKNKEVR